MHAQHERLNFLLQRYTSKTLTAPEQEELTTLLLQDWNHFNNSDSAPVDWERIVQQILSESKTKPVHRIHFLKTTWFKYAAAVLIILSTVAYLWNTQKEKVDPSVSHTNPVPMQSDVAPGGNKATLTLADGNVINLDSVANGQLTVGEKEVLMKTDATLEYSPVIPSEARNPAFHTLSTPRGGQYQLTLPDGSKVWLNAASSITYPTAFTSTKRNVTIKGEVYFEVAKNKKPFIVNIDDKATVEVLGTHFNINAYSEEPTVNTTLLEGSVRIKSVHASLTLKPGQQGQLRDQKLSLAEAPDVEQVMAWKNGTFAFNEADLPTVMRQLARWYDLEIQYEGKIPPRKFTGEIDRNLTLKQVLEGLSYTRVNYVLKGNTLIIHP